MDKILKEDLLRQKLTNERNLQLQQLYKSKQSAKMRVIQASNEVKTQTNRIKLSIETSRREYIEAK